MSKVIILTIAALIVAAVVIVLATWLVLVVRDWFDADRALARRAKQQADDSIYDLRHAQRMAEAEKPRAKSK